MLYVKFEDIGTCVYFSGRDAIAFNTFSKEPFCDL